MNRTMQALLSILIATAPCASPAQVQLTEHTFSAGPDATPPSATIADMAWFAGHWTGPALGGTAEELWIAPVAGSMLGMLRMVKDGKPWLYELQTIVEGKGSLVLKVKHFNSDMSAWEEKDETEDFPLVAKDGNVMHFHGVSFYPEGPNAVTLYVAMKKKDGTYREEAFRYARMGKPSPR